MKLTDLQTPALVLDSRRLESNAKGMLARMKQAGVRLRPHLKSSKSVDVARIAVGDQGLGITVSTVREASYFFKHGFSDIVYAVGIGPNKLQKVASLLQQGADIKIVLDDAGMANSVASHGLHLGVSFPALIEIDCDGHRSGVEPDDAALLEIGKILHQESGATLQGVLTHCGESYSTTSLDQIRDWARIEREAVVSSAKRLRDTGLPCPIVSVGSSPTAKFGENFEGVTEVRAGVYLFNDLYQVGLGVCEESDIAISVLTTVIGHNRKHGRIITDAGMLALSQDRSTAGQRVDRGYGTVCRVEDCEPIPGMIVTDVNQEHGLVIDTGGPMKHDRYPIGTQLRILPSHACTTAASHEKYFVVEGSPEVVHVWPRENHW